MNVNDYIEGLMSLQAKAKKASEKVDLYIQKYIDDNAEFKVGEKIKILTKAHKSYSLLGTKEYWNEEAVRYAYVSKVVVTNGGKFRYHLQKEKKDGTRSKVTDSYGDLDTLLKA